MVEASFVSPRPLHHQLPWPASPPAPAALSHSWPRPQDACLALTRRCARAVCKRPPPRKHAGMRHSTAQRSNRILGQR